jgi:hypothetical protein
VLLLVAAFANQFSQASPEGELTHLSKKGQNPLVQKLTFFMKVYLRTLLNIAAISLALMVLKY